MSRFQQLQKNARTKSQKRHLRKNLSQSLPQKGQHQRKRSENLRSDQKWDSGKISRNIFLSKISRSRTFCRKNRQKNPQKRQMLTMAQKRHLNRFYSSFGQSPQRIPEKPTWSVYQSRLPESSEQQLLMMTAFLEMCI